MKNPKDTVRIIIAEDDEDDRLMIREALEEGRVLNEAIFVENGKELVDLLQNSGENSGENSDGRPSPLPVLILLDLNMPVMDGREALRIIKGDERLRSIPIIALTTSSSEIDVLQSYNLGVNSYITKPVTFEAMVEVMRDLNRYWFEIVQFPPVESKP